MKPSAFISVGCKVQPDSLLGRGSKLGESAILLLDDEHYTFYSFLNKIRIAFFERKAVNNRLLFSFLKDASEMNAVTFARILKLNLLRYPCGF